MSDIRWSYDPRTKELDVWDSNNGRIGHYERHGQDGYEHCSQGRLHKILTKGGSRQTLDSIAASIYSDRPFAIKESEEVAAEATRQEAKKALEEYYHPHPVHWQLNF